MWRKICEVQISKTLPVMRMLTENSVCVHFRRGNYVHNQEVSKVHGCCSHKYYQRAIELIQRKVESPELYVFSDDIPWVKEHFQAGLPVHYVDHNSTTDEHIDLWLMNHCKHHIIANSSFSWWGAWLAQNPEKVVIAPKIWYASGMVASDSLIPSTWHRI